MKKAKGFTLLELIAVIAILAILGAVLVPKIEGYKQAAKKSCYRSSAKVIIDAVDAYNSDNISSPITAGDMFGDEESNDALMKLIVNQTDVTGNSIDKFKNFSIGQIKTITNGDFLVVNDEIKALDGTNNIPISPIE